MDELLADFLTETTEHIEGIESFLVLFEQNPSDADAVTQIFRLLHTIKGTCSFLGLERLRVIAHAAETLVDTLRNGAPPTATAVSLLLRAMDRIKQLVAAMKQAEEEPKGDDLDICNKIEAYLRGETGSEAEPRHRRSSATGRGGRTGRAGTRTSRTCASRRGASGAGAGGSA